MDMQKHLQGQIAVLERQQEDAQAMLGKSQELERDAKTLWAKAEGGLAVCRHLLGKLQREEDEAKAQAAGSEPAERNESATAP